MRPAKLLSHLILGERGIQLWEWLKCRMPTMALGGPGLLGTVAPVVIFVLIWTQEINHPNAQLLDCQKALSVDSMPGRLPTT